MDGQVEFIWKDEARFKHENTADFTQHAALISFGKSLARLLVKATPHSMSFDDLGALHLRNEILSSHPNVNLQGLLAFCWGVGIPVIHLRVFPLERKAMHAMAVNANGRYAILLGMDYSYPARTAFILAHEIGHVLLGHLNDVAALAEFEEPVAAANKDDQEREADEFALTLLASQPDLNFLPSSTDFNAPTLARAVKRAGLRHRIEPGTLALMFAYSRNIWPVSMSALKFIYEEPREMWRVVNRIANDELELDKLTGDASDYVKNILGLSGEDNPGRR